MAVGRVVVHHEYPQVPEKDWRQGGGLLRGVWLSPEPRREREGAAPVRLTLHRDRPAHQGHQAGDDRKAQAGAAVFPRSRGVLLLEGTEDFLLFVGRDADARVAHRAAHAHLLQRGFAGDLHAHDHLALFGELDGVADQVEQHLTQPAGVAHQGVGHVRLHVTNQLQPLLVGSHGQGPQGVTQSRPQGEVGRFQLHGR